MASMQRVGQPTGGPPGGNGLPSPGANNGATGPGTPTSVGTQPPTPQTPTQGNMAALPQQGVGRGGMGTPGQQQQIQQQGGAIPPQHHLHQSQLPPQVQQQLQQVQQGGGGQLPPTNQQWGAGGPPINSQQGMMGHMAGQQQPAVSRQQQQMMNRQQPQPGNRGLMQVTGMSGGATGATASLAAAAAAGAGNLPQAALQELLRVLRSPSSPLQQQQVLNILRSNPPLMAAFIRQRAARYQGGPGGVGGPPQGAPAGVEFQGLRQQQAQRQTLKTLNRGLIHVAEVVHGKLAISSTVLVRFSEAEATVQGIAAKVREALGSEEDVTLTDSQGNEILDSEDTRSSRYWKQNSGIIFALPDSEFRDFQSGQRVKRSRRAEDGDLQDVVQGVESLQGISDSISQLSEMVEKKITEADVQPVKEAFTCLVCMDIMDEPTFSKCCSSLLGCGACVRQWLLTSDHCLKCRSPNFKRNIHHVKGLDAALAFIK